MKTPWLVGAIVLIHCIAVGIVLLMPGCGTPRQTGQRPGAVVEEEVILPPRPADEDPSATGRPSRGSTRPDVRSWPQETSMYVVAKGDSLSGIAARFDVSMTKLMALNGIKNPDMIKTGQTLVVPGDVDTQQSRISRQPSAGEAEGARETDGGQYVVTSGDTLSEIAVDHDTTVKAIKQANNLQSDVIRVGQKLRIPGMDGVGAEDEEAEEAETEEEERQVEPVDLGSGPAETVSSSTEEPEVSEDEEVKTTDTRIHIVGKGEDLKTIAMLWGTSAAKLRELNNLGEGDKVKPGDRIKVPVPQY